MPTLDIMNDDAFSVVELTQSINQQEVKPGRLAALGLFEEKGITTTSVNIERKGSELSLVPNAPRGAPGTPKHGDKRNMISLITTHLPQSATIGADEVQGVRAFGSETELEGVQRVVNDRLAGMREDLDSTIEFQRIGALQGSILDADGAEIINLNSAFGVTKIPFNMALNVGGTKVRNKIVLASRLQKEALGRRTMKSRRALCSTTFYDTFTEHASVATAFDRWQNGEFFRSDMQDGFFFGGVFWEIYDGSVGTTDFIPSGSALLLPEGVSGLFRTVFAPANYMETVNTQGLPYYAKQELLKFGKGVEIESQSNPLSYCALPAAVIELTVS